MLLNSHFSLSNQHSIVLLVFFFPMHFVDRQLMLFQIMKQLELLEEQQFHAFGSSIAFSEKRSIPSR